jgi:hypothetical protein
MSSDHPVRFLDGYVELPEFARDEVKRSPSTVTRWTQGPDGLPYTMMGRTVLIHIPTAREWLLNRMRRRNSRRQEAA